MSIGLLGKKLGMTHVYDDFGRRITVTAVEAGPCTVLELREPKRHGYQAVQVGFQTMKEKHATKARIGHFKKSGAGPFRHVREFRLGSASATSKKMYGEVMDIATFTVGQQLTVEIFQQYEVVDVTGTSIGKGFQGGMKRWHWKGGRATHGSMQHRQPGSIGSTTTPGRVWKGHHLPGHMGNARVTVQNLRIIMLDAQHNLLLIDGAIPGADEQLVLVQKSRKHPGLVKKPQEFAAIIEDDEGLSKTAKAASKALKPAAKK